MAICGGRSRRPGPLRCDWFELYAIERASDEVWKCDDRWERRADPQRPWDSVRPSRGRSRETHWRISTGVRRFGLTATFFVFTTPIGKDSKLMTWQQLRELQAAGMTIGSHTRTHPVLPDYHAALHNEVEMSRADIEQHLGRTPHFFAYPFGAWDAQSAASARTAGYRAARTFRGCPWNAPSDLYHLRAVPITDDMQAFERAVSGSGPRVVVQKAR